MFTRQLCAVLLVLGLAALATAETPATPARKVIPIDAVGDRKIVVDGDLNEWGIDARRSLVLDECLDASYRVTWPDPRRATSVRLLYDDQALYIGIRTTDTSRVRNEKDISLGDAVELFLDVRPTTPADGPKRGDAKYSDGVWEIGITAPSADNAVVWQQYNGAQRKMGPFTVAGKNLPDGYGLELRLPYASLGIDATRLKTALGFDIQVIDADVNPATGASLPANYYAWDHGSLYRDASLFSDAVADAKLPNVPYLRAFIPGLLQKPTLRLVAAGFILPGDAPQALDAVDLQMRTAAGVNALLVDLPPVDVATYPQLGARVVHRVVELPSLKLGTYTVTATLGNAAATMSGTFSTLSWSKQAMQATPPAHPEAILPGETPDAATLLHNGWRITPAGHALMLPGDLPLRLFFTPDGHYLITNTAGFHNHAIFVIDPTTLQIVDQADVRGTWAGLALLPNGHDLYASAGRCALNKPKDAPAVLTGAVLHFTLQDGHLTPRAAIDLPAMGSKGGYIGGMAVGADGSLYVVDTNNDCLYRLAGEPMTVQASVKLPYRPYMPAVSPNGKLVVVTNWGDETISVLNAKTLEGITNIKVGSHPNDLTFATNGGLFVANAGDNSVSALGSDPERVNETILTALDPTDPVGSTPDAVAVSPDGKRLYVANADNNDVAVVDISAPQESRLLGFIPTGWYPSALAVSPDGKRLFIGVGKGFKSSSNANGKYIPSTLAGAVSVVDVPDTEQLAAYTRQARANSPLRQRWQLTAADEKNARAAFKHIKHVVYIIRENRTYDQVLGDFPGGHGDPNLTMFGKEVTPNGHALAGAFVLLDNLYCNGEVSEDGHEWCDAAYATDFTEKAWVNSYSGKGEPEADERLTASPAGYLWDNCARHGLTYRAYGECADFVSTPNSPPIFYGSSALKGHACQAYAQKYWADRDTECARIFIDELHTAEQSGQWPNFMVMSLPEDHTFGLGAGRFTPTACVASNDLALGQIVEAISHSRFWKETAIFVIEDDAQNGADHIDAHRTVGLVISPYIRREAIDSTFYTTSSFVRTMEEILGLPTMTQYDRGATPLYHAFMKTPVLTPYTAQPALVNLQERNAADTPGALKSALLDFSAPDRADFKTLNAILWVALKPGMPMPAPVRGALYPAAGEDKD